MKTNKFIFYLLLALGLANCDGPNSTEKKAIKEEIEKAYLNLMALSDENNLQQPFYNPNLGTSFTLLLSPVFLNGATISAENIEVLDFIDDATADVKYQLHVTTASGEKKIEINMTVKKVGGTWKLDAEKFLPKQQAENTEQENENIEKYTAEAARITDSIAAAGDGDGDGVVATDGATEVADDGAGDYDVSQGSISGKNGYPSEFVPENVNVYAHNIQTNDVIKQTSLNRSTGDYVIEVPDGEYYIFSGPNNNVNDKRNGFYSQMVPCGLSTKCNDHTLIKVIIKGGNQVKNINTGDWFMP